MDLQLASFGDLDQISTIEKETNEYPWTPNNFKSSLDAGNSSIVLKAVSYTHLRAHET